MTTSEDLDDVASGFVLAVSKLRRRLQQLPVEQGVTIPELATLVRLDRFGPQTGSALAKAEQISPQAVGTTVGALESKGLIARGGDPGDRRRVVWSLTGAGREIVRHKQAVRTRQVSAALRRLDPTEVAALHAALPAMEKVVDHL
ncbi:MAG: MarR family transcriptional regulator [Nocardioides sp.]|uniref:MarR family winged helix-turn-helix transcriptional regulator n=1 Tax=Nocardioides sp. TaxID=35761 RepID=UPI0039E6789D